MDGDHESIAVITMDRPSAKNAISRVFLSQLSEAIESLRSSPLIRVLVLTSNVPGAVCAGADLKVNIY